MRLNMEREAKEAEVQERRRKEAVRAHTSSFPAFCFTVSLVVSSM